MKAHLEGVKVGDTIKCAGRFHRKEDLFLVERVGANIVRCSGGESFRIDSGLMIGTGSDSYGRRYGRIASADDIARITLETAIRSAQAKLAKCVVTADNLEAAEAFIAASQPKTA
jgi:hypothetical protein